MGDPEREMVSSGSAHPARVDEHGGRRVGAGDGEDAGPPVSVGPRRRDRHVHARLVRQHLAQVGEAGGEQGGLTASRRHAPHLAVGGSFLQPPLVGQREEEVVAVHGEGKHPAGEEHPGRATRDGSRHDPGTGRRRDRTGIEPERGSARHQDVVSQERLGRIGLRQALDAAALDAHALQHAADAGLGRGLRVEPVEIAGRERESPHRIADGSEAHPLLGPAGACLAAAGDPADEQRARRRDRQPARRVPRPVTGVGHEHARVLPGEAGPRRLDPLAPR